INEHNSPSQPRVSIMRYIPPGVTCFLLLLLAGCAGHPYRPYNSGVGYAHTIIAPDTYQISFNGGSTIAPTTATHYATVRAAELALRVQKPYFALVDSEVIMRERTHVTPEH